MANVAKLKKRALDFEQKKQFDKALEIYAQILDGLDEHVDEADMALYNRVGDLMLRRGNTSAAVDHYEKAVDLYMEGGFFNNAIALCNKVLRNAPGRASVYYKLGKISAQKGFINDAKQNFLEYADRMQQGGDFEEAFRALKEFADLCPDQDDIRLMLADQLVRKERKGEAVEQLQRLHDKLQAEGRESEARATADRMKAIDPDVEPRVGSFMPTPRSSDLIFLDVNYDGPAGDERRAPGARADGMSPAGPTTPSGTRPLIQDHAPVPEPDPTPESVDLPFLDVGDGKPDESSPEPKTAERDSSAPASLEPVTSEEAPAVQATLEPIAIDPPSEDEPPLDTVAPIDGLITSFDEVVLADADDDGRVADRSSLELDTGALDGMQVNQLTAETVDRAGPAAAADARVPAAGMDGDLPMLDLPLEEELSPANAELTTVPALEEAQRDPVVPEDDDRGALGSAVVDVRQEVPETGAGERTASTPESSAAVVDGSVEPSIAPEPDEATETEATEAQDEGTIPAHPTPPAELRTTPPAAWQSLATAAADPDAEPSVTQAMGSSALAEEEAAQDAGAGAPSPAEAEPPADGEGAASVQLADAPAGDAEAERGVDVEGAAAVAENAESAIPPESPPNGEPEGLDAVRDDVARETVAAGEPEVEPADAPGARPSAQDVGAEDVGDDVGDAAPAPEPASAPHPTDQLRVAITQQPQDWHLRRKLAEALFEEGNRAGGLKELEAVMLGLEDAKDLTGASAMVDEIIRVEPNSIRHHQKRVEYAVRSNDKARLVDSYVDLAEALFRVGELDKSRIVYGRVLELAPTDERVRSALRTIGEDRVTRDGAARAGARGARATPTAPAATPTPASPSAPGERWRRPTPTPSAMRVVPREPATDAFVNLADWLKEEAAPKSTRMVVDVREPAHNEQVDFAEMLAMFKKGVAANVDEADHESHYDLGVAYKEMGLLDEAISEFQKALRGADDRVRTYEALGQCFVEKEQYQIASAILTRALSDKHSTDDMLVGVLYLLGVASEMLQRWQDAQRYYERVFAIDIGFRDVNERLTAMSRRVQ